MNLNAQKFTDLLYKARFENDGEAIQDVGAVVSRLIKNESEKLANFTNSSAHPTLPDANIFTQINALASDTGWQSIFKEMAPRSGTDIVYDVRTVGSNIGFIVTAEGEPVRIQTTSGQVSSVYAEKYTSAFGVSDETIRLKDANSVAEAVEMTVASYFETRARKMYGLLWAGQSGSTSYNSTGSTVLEKDILTVNAGSYTLRNRNKDKGYGEPAELVLLCSPAIEDRLRAALNPLGVGAGVGNKVLSNIRLISSFNYAAHATNTTDALLIIPGRKLGRIETPLEQYTNDDWRTFVHYQSFKFYLGGAVLDGGQVLKVAFA